MVSDKAAITGGPGDLRFGLHLKLNDAHEQRPVLKTKGAHMRAFSCFKGIYKRVCLCDDLRVKYHGLVLHSGFDVVSTLSVLTVD